MPCFTMPSYRICPVLGTPHDNIRKDNPEWRFCGHCESQLSSPSIVQENNNTIINLISPEQSSTPSSINGDRSTDLYNAGLARASSLLAGAMTPAFRPKSELASSGLNEFARAYKTAEQERSRSIQSTMKSSQPLQAMISLDLYLGEYRPTYLDDEEIPKWERLELCKRFTARPMMLEQRHESYTDMIRHILHEFNVGTSLYNKEWELVQNVTKGNGGTIYEFGIDTSGITTLRSLLSKIHTTPKRKDPFTMVLLARKRLPPVPPPTKKDRRRHLGEKEIGPDEDGSDIEVPVQTEQVSHKGNRQVKSEASIDPTIYVKTGKVSVKRSGISRSGRRTQQKVTDPFTMELRASRKRALSDDSTEKIDSKIGRTYLDKSMEEEDQSDHDGDTLLDQESDVSTQDLVDQD